MYSKEFEASLKAVEAAREANIAYEPVRMTAQEKDDLLAAYHPDYKKSEFSVLKIGPNKGEEVPHELCEMLQAHSRIKASDVDLNDVRYDVDVLIIGGGGAGASAAIEADNAGAKTMIVTKLRIGDANTMMAEGGIQAVAVNTLGVLYVVEKGGDTIQSMADLAGRTILSTGKGTTPEYVLRYLLNANGIDPDKDVTIEYYSEATEVTAQMAAARKDAIAVLPQPYVTAAQMKDSDLRVVLDLTREWNKVCDTQLITGVTVVRTEYAKENPDIVANFLRDYEKSIKAAQTDIAGTAALCEETGVVAKKAIAQKALPQCNIVYRVGDEMKADVNAYLKVLYDASPAAVGGKLPDANFYYTKATPGQVFWRSVQRSFQ